MYIYAVPGLHPTFNVLPGYSGTGVNFFVNAANKIRPKFRIVFEIDFYHAHLNANMVASAASPKK
jgi:hypothetical protein